jgi:hypothetical protein
MARNNHESCRRTRERPPRQLTGFFFGFVHCIVHCEPPEPSLCATTPNVEHDEIVMFWG